MTAMLYLQLSYFFGSASQQNNYKAGIFDSLEVLIFQAKKNPVNKKSVRKSSAVTNSPQTNAGSKKQKKNKIKYEKPPLPPPPSYTLPALILPKYLMTSKIADICFGESYLESKLNDHLKNLFDKGKSFYDNIMNRVDQKILLAKEIQFDPFRQDYSVNISDLLIKSHDNKPIPTQSITVYGKERQQALAYISLSRTALKGLENIVKVAEGIETYLERRIPVSSISLNPVFAYIK